MGKNLAVVLDCYDGAIIGYAVAVRMIAGLCCKALSAVVRRSVYFSR